MSSSTDEGVGSDGLALKGGIGDAPFAGQEGSTEHEHESQTEVPVALPELSLSSEGLDLSSILGAGESSTEDERVQKRASHVQKLALENEKLKEELRMMSERLEAAEERRKALAEKSQGVME